MKRREFLSSAGAAAVIPVLPLPAMATPVATAPVRATQVGWAALFARVNDRATPALLQKWMGGRTRASERLDVRIGQAKHHPRPRRGNSRVRAAHVPKRGHSGRRKKCRSDVAEGE